MAKQSTHHSAAQVPKHTQPISNGGYSNATISAYEGYISSPFDGNFPLVSRSWQSDQSIHQAQPPIPPLLSQSSDPQLESFSGAQRSMSPIFVPSLIEEDYPGSTCRNHPTQSEPRNARIPRRSVLHPGKFKSLRGQNSGRHALHHSDRLRRLSDTRKRLQRLHDTRNRLSPPSHLRTSDSRRQQGYFKNLARTAESSKSKSVLYPEAESWASQYMRRRRPTSMLRENTPLQPFDQASGSDSELDRDIPEAYDASRYRGNGPVDRAETSSLANSDAEQFNFQSNVAVPNSGSPPSPFAGNYISAATLVPADIDVEKSDPRESPFSDSEILAPSPVRSVVDVERACSPSLPFPGTGTPIRFHSHSNIDTNEPYFSRSSDLATTSLRFLPDWNPEEFHQQASTDMNTRHQNLAGVNNLWWDQPLAFSRATDRGLSDAFCHIAGDYAPPGLDHESRSHEAAKELPRHEVDDIPGIINQRSHPTAAQINGFQRASSMSNQVQSSEPLWTDSPILHESYPLAIPSSNFNNLHAEAASTQISFSEESRQLEEQDETNDDESEGTVLGDEVDLDGA